MLVLRRNKKEKKKRYKFVWLIVIIACNNLAIFTFLGSKASQFRVKMNAAIELAKKKHSNC